MRRFILLALLTLSIIVLSACDSEEVKQAKEAYENKDYAKTVEILSKEKIEDDDVKDIMTFSEAHILLDKKDYAAAVEKAASASAGKESDEYKEIYKEALDNAVDNYDAKKAAAILKVDSSKEKSVYKKVKKECDDLNYDAFVFSDELLKAIGEGELKDKLSSYAKENWKKKVSAFLIADWEWVENTKKRTTVRVVQYKDDFLGKVTTVGDLEKDYHYKKDDLYWQKFDIVDEKSVNCENLTKTEDGSPLPETVTMHLNYKKNRISIHMTGTAGYNLRSLDRIWKRLGK